MQENFIVPRGAGDTVTEAVGKSQRDWQPFLEEAEALPPEHGFRLHTRLAEAFRDPWTWPISPSGPFGFRSCPL